MSDPVVKTRSLSPRTFVDPRFVSDVQMHKYWRRKDDVDGWRVRITHETVFAFTTSSFVVMERLVAFYLVDFGSNFMPVVGEYADVLFTLSVHEFLHEYVPITLEGGRL